MLTMNGKKIKEKGQAGEENRGIGGGNTIGLSKLKSGDPNSRATSINHFRDRRAVLS
jgi:hypothetical protein